jgi:hypothetical protein
MHAIELDLANGEDAYKSVEVTMEGLHHSKQTVYSSSLHFSINNLNSTESQQSIKT